MIGLTIYDFLLFPIYLYAIIFIFKKIREKYRHDKSLYFYFTWAFRIKIAVIIVYTLLAHFVIRGDAVDLYFGEGKHFAKMITDGSQDLDLLVRQGGQYIDNLASDEEKGYLAMENNYMVVKIAIVLCLLTFSTFLPVNLIIGFIAFLGSWQLFLFFRRIYPKLHRELAIACLGIPTVLFWSSGISKDTVCIACLGFFTKALFDIVNERKRVKANAVLIIISVYLIYSIKSYILFSYMPFFLLFLILHTINKTNVFIIRLALKAVIPMMFLAFSIYLINNSRELFSEYSTERILSNISVTQSSFNKQAASSEGSFFSLGEFDGSISGLIGLAPKAVMATFFRPFIWESRNLIMIFSSLEAMALMLFTLKIFFSGRGIFVFFRTIFTNAVVFYCFSFALLFAVFVGVSSFNFGSLVRYKIPCMPFFLISLFIIHSKLKHDDKEPHVVTAAEPTGS